MKKPKNALPKFNQGQSLPAAPTPTPTQTPVPETDEQRQARADRANQEVREILKKENCILTVPYLDISSGRVLPHIVLKAQPLTA